jgi:hypothetical protein
VVFVFGAVGQGEYAGRLMIERSRFHRCEDPEGFCKGIGQIIEEATAGTTTLQLGTTLVRTS